MVDLEGDVAVKDKRIANLETDRAQKLKEHEEMKNELCKARDEVGVAKDEAEELKLELEHVQERF